MIGLIRGLNGYGSRGHHRQRRNGVPCVLEVVAALTDKPTEPELVLVSVKGLEDG